MCDETAAVEAITWIGIRFIIAFIDLDTCSFGTKLLSIVACMSICF